MSHTFPLVEGHNGKQGLIGIYDCLRDFVATATLDLCGSGTAKILAYLESHSKQNRFIEQDLLPLLVYVAISEQSFEHAIPLSAGWTLYLAAAHLLDDAQDNGNISSANASAAAFGLANMALAQMQTDPDTLRDILDAFGRVAVLGANAQNEEQSRGRVWSRTDYFQAITGKAATIIATGVWAGGRLATSDPQTLTILREFGLTWGLATQLSDDCLDLTEDLGNGIYTLPVIEGLSKTGHPKFPVLKRLLEKTHLIEPEIKTIVNILEEMGTITLCKKLVCAYQAQAAAAFDVLPGLATYFTDYVSFKSR